MKKTGCILFSIAILLSISGCDKDTNVEVQYAPLQDVYNNISISLKENYENLTLPRDISIDRVDYLETYKTIYPIPPQSDTEKKERLKAFVELMAGEFHAEGVEEIVERKCYCYKNIDEKSGNGVYARLTSGEVLYSSGDIPFYFTGEKLNVYHLDRGDSVDEQFIKFTENNEWSISDAIEYSDSLLKKNLASYLSYADMRVKNVIVSEFPNQMKQLTFEYEYLVDGIPVDTIGDAHGDWYMLTPQLYVSFDAPNHIGNIWASMSFPHEEPQQLKDSFVTLGSALRVLEQHLASKHTYTVSDIELQYACLTKMGQDTAYQYRPYWRIVLYELQPGAMQSTGQIAAYVDMQNGQLCIYDSIDGTRDDFPNN